MKMNKTNVSQDLFLLVFFKKDEDFVTMACYPNVLKCEAGGCHNENVKTKILLIIVVVTHQYHPSRPIILWCLQEK